MKVLSILFLLILSTSVFARSLATNEVQHCSSACTVNSTAYIVTYDSSAGSFNIQLPDPAEKRELIFSDETAGDWTSNGVTLLQYGSEKISGVAASKVIPPNWGSQSGILLISDGVNYNQVGITF